MQFLAHDLLLELVAAEYPDFLHTLGQSILHEGMAKGAGTAGHEYTPQTET
jgi:hypothetical protein